jgi:ribosomal protein L37AE/L43A
MIEMADIFRQYKDEYLRDFGSRILPSHRRAIDDIISCRTPALGGNLYSCPSCGKKKYSYHSCGNRHCPKCGNDDATRWVEKQSARIPEVPCFLLTFTLPHELNKVVRSNQKNCYGLLFGGVISHIIRMFIIWFPVAVSIRTVDGVGPLTKTSSFPSGRSHPSTVVNSVME